MPRPSKGARLYFDKSTDKWVIRDGTSFRRTGCAKANREGADRQLAEYIAKKYDPLKHAKKEKLDIASVLNVYAKEHIPHIKAKQTALHCINNLSKFWGDKYLTDIRAATCREYAEERRKKKIGSGTIRRELAVLSAAINYWHKEYGPLPAVPAITKPPESPAREIWLTRSEVARLLLGALGWTYNKGAKRWKRSTFHINRHTARFIILGYYTGTRHNALVRLSWSQQKHGGWVDLESGVLFRRGSGDVETAKRQTPVRIGGTLLAHLKRWRRMDKKIRWVVHYDGRPVTRMKRSWNAAVKRAGLSKNVTPHVLRHTKATWLMHDGVNAWEAAGFLGMGLQMLEKKYGHHHADYQRRAAGDQK